MNMKTLMALRLTLWGIIVSLCASIIALYLATSQTLLEQSKLEDIARQGDVYTTMRDDMITPKLLTAAHDSGYSSIVNEKLVTSSVAQAFPDDTLEALLEPALVSVGRWLDSRESVPTFTIDISAPLKKFVDTLSGDIAARYMQLPDCTYLNSYDDIQNAVCKTPGVSEEQVQQEVTEALFSQQLIEKAEFTSEQITLPDNVVAAGSHIPQTISILYAASIFAAGIGLFAIFRLVLKHRFYGIIAVGAAGIVSAATIWMAADSIRAYTGDVALDDTYRAIATSTAAAYTQAIESLLIPLVIVGVALIAAGVAGARLMQKQARQSELHVAHNHTHREDDEA